MVPSVQRCPHSHAITLTSDSKIHIIRATQAFNGGSGTSRSFRFLRSA
jgi:hypothetical protein